MCDVTPEMLRKGAEWIRDNGWYPVAGNAACVWTAPIIAHNGHINYSQIETFYLKWFKCRAVGSGLPHQ